MVVNTAAGSSATTSPGSRCVVENVEDLSKIEYPRLQYLDVVTWLERSFDRSLSYLRPSLLSPWRRSGAQMPEAWNATPACSRDFMGALNPNYPGWKQPTKATFKHLIRRCGDRDKKIDVPSFWAWVASCAYHFLWRHRAVHPAVRNTSLSRSSTSLIGGIDPIIWWHTEVKPQGPCSLSVLGAWRENQGRQGCVDWAPIQVERDVNDPRGPELPYISPYVVWFLFGAVSPSLPISLPPFNAISTTQTTKPMLR